MKMKNNIIFGIFLTVALLLVSGDASAAVFKELAQKTAKFAGELRYLAYAISGFGIVMFTFLAICGKINFKHLGYIVMSLFFLSGTAALITYVSDQPVSLEYRDTYVAAGTSIGKLNRNSSL